MNHTLGLACGLLVMSLSTPVIAAPVAWTFTGTVSERFDAVSDDPIADLLAVPRASVNDITLSLRIVVDTAAAATVLEDSSALQRVTYADAIERATLTLNGVAFSTLRRPGVQLGGAIDESEIRVTNAVASNGTDNLTLTLGNLIFVPGLTPLFDSYTVPFNQTLGGTPVASAGVLAPFMSVNISGPGMFSGVDLPATDGAFSGANFVAIGAVVLSDFGLGFGNGSLSLELHDLNFTASPVPLPPALALFAPALAVLARQRRATGRAGDSSSPRR